MISSPLSATVAEMLSRSNVNMALAAQIDFASGTSRVHSGVGEILIGGEVFYGLGSLGQASAVTEENNTSAQSISLTLNGLDNNLISISLNEKVIGKLVTCYLAVFDDDMTELAYDLLYQGTISQTALVAGDEGALTYTVANIFQEWSKGKPWRYTDESHLKMYPDDHIFRYTGQMADRSIFWGSKKDAPAFKYN